MIIACDQYDEIIRLAWGEDLESTEVEEYEVQEEALRRIQELAAAAEKIVISQESSFAKKQQDEGKTVSRVHRLEAVYWGLRERTNGDRCLILSIGQESCAGGVIQGGYLINQRMESRHLTLRSIAAQVGEKNPQLMQALKGQYEGNTSDAQEALLRELSKSLRGKAEPSFFFHSPSFPQLAKLLSIPLKAQIQEFLAQLDPQREIKTLICTDWAATGSLAELLQDEYQVVCSENDPLTDAVRGMVLFGWIAAERGAEEQAATLMKLVREKLDGVRHHYPLVAILHEMKMALLPLWSPSDAKLFSEEGTAYIALVDEWEALLREPDQQREQKGTDRERHAQRLLEAAEAVEEKAARLSRDYRPIWFIPLLEKAALIPPLSEKLGSLKNILGIEDIRVDTEAEVGNLDEFDVARTRGTGTRIIIDEVIERGYREKATGAVIKKPRVAVRLEEAQAAVVHPKEEPIRIDEIEIIRKKKFSSALLLSSVVVVSLLAGFLLTKIVPGPGKLSPPPGGPTPEPPGPPPPRPPLVPPLQPYELSLLRDGRQYIRAMLASASEDGGIAREGEIAEAKRRLEELHLKERPVGRDRRKARKENERGLTYIANAQFPEAVQSFQAAHQADLADVEITNNLGDAYFRKGDFAAAEQYLFLTLVLVPERANAWFNLGQTYAKPNKLKEAVACFANAYRFSGNRGKTYQLLQSLAEKDADEGIRRAAAQALRLQLLQIATEPPQPQVAEKTPQPPPPPLPPSLSLTAKIETQLCRDGLCNVKARQISQSTIHLTGEVASRREREKAVAIANAATSGSDVIVVEYEIDIVRR